jgi:hypothetical protein
MKKKLFPVFIVTAAAYSLLIIADYLNLPSYFGIDVPAMNWDFLSLTIGNGLVITLYIVTYCLIDYREIQRANNQVRNTRKILVAIYSQCKEQIEDLDNSEMRSLIANKCDFNIPRFQEPIFLQMQNAPFELEQYIMDASNNGVLSDSEIQAYLSIRKNYKEYVSTRVTYFDIEDVPDKTQLQRDMYKRMLEKREYLLERLEMQIFTLGTNYMDGKLKQKC